LTLNFKFPTIVGGALFVFLIFKGEKSGRKFDIYISWLFATKNKKRGWRW